VSELQPGPSLARRRVVSPRTSHLHPRDRQRRGPLGLRWVAVALPVAACNSAPTMDLLGSYFPAWMLCAAVGIIAAIIIRQVLAVAGITDYVVAPLLTYAGLAVSATLLTWLLWFGH
jgi:hypothetical protein